MINAHLIWNQLIKERYQYHNQHLNTETFINREHLTNNVVSGFVSTFSGFVKAKNEKIKLYFILFSFIFFITFFCLLYGNEIFIKLLKFKIYEKY